MNRPVYALTIVACTTLVTAAWIISERRAEELTQFRTATQILQSCAKFGFFGYLDWHDKPAKIPCVAPEGTRFVERNGEVVVEFEQHTSRAGAVRL